tara:strand:- start:127 stop:1776 length:1650 start_codon:yes stop_codon:yes gene_type:complete
VRKGVLDFSAWSDVVDKSVSEAGAEKYGDTVFTLAKQKSELTPDGVALIGGDGKAVSYRQIFKDACRLRVALQEMGVCSGDVVSIQLPNWAEAAVINIAVSGLGGVINPIPAIYRSAEIRAILDDARSKVLFAPSSFRSTNYRNDISEIRESLTSLLDVVYVRCDDDSCTTYEKIMAESDGDNFKGPEVDPNSAKLLLYTSGTTGKPKGVLHSHVAMREWPRFLMSEWGLGEGDVMFMPSPVTHVTGYSFGLELPFITPVKAVLMDQWEASAALALINNTGSSACVGATPFLKELIDQAENSGDRLETMKIFACGGASVPPDLIYRVKKVTERCQAFRVYGSTEVPMVTRGFPSPDDIYEAAETDGKVAGYEVKIVDINTGEPISSSEQSTGEIKVRGPAMMIGYTDRKENINALDCDKYFFTGDIGYLTEKSALIITGRKKDIIIRGGENLSPKEIEDALGRHPNIEEAAVVGMPHARLGEGVCAFVRVSEVGGSIDVAAVAEFLELQGLARQKFPERIECVEEFPRTPSGKIKKDILRNKLIKNQEC